MCVSLEQSHWILPVTYYCLRFYTLLLRNLLFPLAGNFQVYALGAGQYENHLFNMPCIINVNAELQLLFFFAR